MSSRPLLTPLVRALPPTVPFVGPEAQERDRGRPFARASAPMRAASALRPRSSRRCAQAAPDMWMYCDPDNFDLKTRFAAHLGVGYGNVVVGEGIDGLLNLAVRMFVAPGDAGGDLARRLSDLQLPRRGFRRAAGDGAL